MKNLFSILAIIFLVPFIGFSQEDQIVLLLSNKGKVVRTINKSKKASINAGSVLKSSSSIELAKDATALLYSNGQFKEIKKSGTIALKKVFSNTARISSLNFDSYFGEYLNASIGTVNYMNENKEFSSSKVLSGNGWGVSDPKTKGGWGVSGPKTAGGWGITEPKTKGGWGVTDPKTKGGWGVTDPKTKGGWGVTDPKTKGGWSEKDIVIDPATPGGIYRNSSVELKWLKQPAVEKYTFYIMDENLNFIFSKMVQDTILTVNLNELNLSTDISYYWQVVSENVKLEVSTPVGFKIISEEDYNEIKNVITDSEIYKIADNSTRLIMEAVAMEKSNMYYDAVKIFENLRISDPTNNLIKITYTGFCMRTGQLAKAKLLLK